MTTCFVLSVIFDLARSRNALRVLEVAVVVVVAIWIRYEASAGIAVFQSVV